jgi:hypothetical protein
MKEQKDINLDVTEESYNQDPPLSIYPKNLPHYLNVVKNAVTGYNKAL